MCIILKRLDKSCIVKDLFWHDNFLRLYKTKLMLHNFPPTLTLTSNDLLLLILEMPSGSSYWYILSQMHAWESDVFKRKGSWLVCCWLDCLSSRLLLLPGLPKLFHPAIPDGRTWRKFGEHGQHGEHGEHGKDGKHQPDDSKVTRRLLKEKSKLTFVDV